MSIVKYARSGMVEGRDLKNPKATSETKLTPDPEITVTIVGRGENAPARAIEAPTRERIASTR